MIQYSCSDCSSPYQDFIYQYRNLFQTVPGKTIGMCHYIPTTGSTIKVPPRWRPAHYCTKVDRQVKCLPKKSLNDVETYCQQCTKCQSCKPPNPIRAPLHKIPISQLWETVATDIL